MQQMAYTKKVQALLSPAECRVFKKLTTPQKIQDYLDTLEINFEERGETLMSPRRVLREKKAHCIEAALFAAAALAYHGSPPLLLDLQTSVQDEDHVVTLFKQNNLWGAISKTNHMILRWRDPVYRSVRELTMSYMHEYYMSNGKKTLLAYSRLFDLRRYKPECWVTAEKNLEWVAEDLDISKHFPIAPKKVLAGLRRASPIERAASELVEWKKGARKPY
ncbi:MAG: hypothetical protein Q7S26_03025 [bacterium]|nr:hypothetical protein [bacterium]